MKPNPIAINAGYAAWKLSLHEPIDTELAALKAVKGRTAFAASMALALGSDWQKHPLAIQLEI